MILSAPQIAALAKGAGFSGANVAIAVAVALAESGGDTTATNKNTNGTTDYGVWQINSSHLSELGVTGDQLFDPRTNAAAAYHVYQTQGWGAWSTYNSGKYQKYGSQAQQAASNPSTQFADFNLGPITVPFPSIPNPLNAAGDALNAVVAPFSAIADAASTIGHIISFIFSQHFLYLVGGSLLLILALYLIAKESGNAPSLPVPIPG